MARGYFVGGNSRLTNESNLKVIVVVFMIMDLKRALIASVKRKKRRIRRGNDTCVDIQILTFTV